MSKHSAQGIVLVKRKPENANGDVLKQQITLIAKDGANALKISDLSQFIKDLEGAGIVVSENQIDLIANKTYIRDGENGTPIALFADGKLNANLINADTITVNHLYAKSAQGGTVVGHFGNYEKSDAVAGDDKCPLWLGATTAANAPFRVTKDGAMYAVKGTIGGFKIGSNYIGSQEMTPPTKQSGSVNKMYMTDNMIVFNDKNYSYSNGGLTTLSSKSAAIGTETSTTAQKIFLKLSAEVESADSYTALASINIRNYSGSVNSLTSRTGLAISVKDAGYNYAIHATNGNIIANGMVASYRHCLVNMTSAKTWYPVTSLRDNNVLLVKCTASNCVLVLPRLTDVRAALNISSSVYFNIKLTIIARKDGTSDFSVNGRKAGSGYSSTEYPQYLTNDAENSDGVGMGVGDVLELALVYDSTGYYTYVLNYRN